MGDAGGTLASAHRSFTTVRSLDQLYMQAVAVAPLFRAAAEQWAAAAQGEVDTAGLRILEQELAWARAQWAGEPLIKGAGRADPRGRIKTVILKLSAVPQAWDSETVVLSPLLAQLTRRQLSSVASNGSVPATEDENLSAEIRKLNVTSGDSTVKQDDGRWRGKGKLPTAIRESLEAPPSLIQRHIRSAPDVRSSVATQGLPMEQHV